MARNEERTTQVPEIGHSDEATAGHDLLDGATTDQPSGQRDDRATDEVPAIGTDDRGTAVDGSAVRGSDLDADTIDELRVTLGAGEADLDVFPDDLDEHGEGPTSIHHARTSDRFERVNLPLTHDDFEETGVVHVDDAPSRSAELDLDDDDDDDDDDFEEIIIDDAPYVVEYTEHVARQGDSGRSKLLVVVAAVALAIALAYLATR